MRQEGGCYIFSGASYGLKCPRPRSIKTTVMLFTIILLSSNFYLTVVQGKIIHVYQLRY